MWNLLLANPKATQLWFGKAREDLKAAKHLRPLEKDFYSVIVFHCQQASEKAIKGFLTHNNVRVLKTHDMEKLLNAVASVNSELASKYDQVITMSKYAVEHRYPDADQKLPLLTEKIVLDAVSLAEEIFNELSSLVQN